MGKYYGLTHVYYYILSSRDSFPLINGYSAVRFSLFSTVSSFFAVLMLPNFIKEKNIYKKIIGLLFIFELIIRYFTFSPYSQYFYLLHILSGIIIFSELIKSKSIYMNIILSFFVIAYFFHSIEFILSQNKKSSLSEQVKMLQYVIDNTDDNDTVLNGMLDYFNMFRQDADYIWFAANDTGYIYDLHYNTKRYDINEIIKRKKPKFINTYEVSLIPYYRRINVLNKYNFDTLRLFQLKQETKFTIDDVLVKVPNIIYHKFDMEYIKKYYEPTPYENLWMRKDNISE
jgi:hypothetical protein